VIVETVMITNGNVETIGIEGEIIDGKCVYHGSILREVLVKIICVDGIRYSSYKYFS
jgi:hypothetical protein